MKCLSHGKPNDKSDFFQGTVAIRHVGDERRHNKACSKCIITGQALWDQRGLTWVNRSAGYIEAMETPIPENPAWEDFKFELFSANQMELGMWDKFIESEFKKLKAVGD